MRSRHRPQALQVGRALASLGPLHHVVHERKLENQDLFYRSDCVTMALVHTPGEALQLLKLPHHAVTVADRVHPVRSYLACWIGAQALDLLHTRRKLSREDAAVLLNQRWRYGLIRHVVDDHPVKDNHLHYRSQD